MNSRLHRTLKEVGAVFGHYAREHKDPDGRPVPPEVKPPIAWCGISTVARACGLSVRWTQYAVRELERLGVLSLAGSRAGGQRAGAIGVSAKYEIRVLALDRIPEAGHSDQWPPPGGRRDAQRRVQFCAAALLKAVQALHPRDESARVAELHRALGLNGCSVQHPSRATDQRCTKGEADRQDGCSRPVEGVLPTAPEYQEDLDQEHQEITGADTPAPPVGFGQVRAAMLSIQAAPRPTRQRRARGAGARR